MYRSRLGNDLDDVTLRYVSSVEDDSEIIHYDILGSQAHVLMLYRKGILKMRDLKRILSALEDIRNEGEAAATSGAAEDVHEMIESMVIKRAGMESGGRMHTARSRNDQVALDMRMKIRDDINAVCRCLLDTAEAMISVARIHQRTVMPLYTHLQQAQAGLFSHYLLAHADALLRDFQRLYGTFERVNQSPLGAGPAGGTSIPIDRHDTARMLGFDGLVENSLDATGTRDFVAEYIAMISIMMTNLSRMAEDLVVWSTSEFSFVELADEFTSPSSVMPQKKNPDILELTRGKTAHTIGGLTAVLSALKGLASGYGRDLQQIKAPVWAASRMSVSALLVMRSVILTMRVNEKQMRKAAVSGNLIALDIAERLVLEGIPFRITHKIAGSLVQAAHLSKRPIRRLDAADILGSVEGTGVDAEVVSRIASSTTVASSMKARTSYGSSGYAEQKRMISDRVAAIERYRTDLTKRENRISACIEGLGDEVGRIVGSGKGATVSS